MIVKILSSGKSFKGLSNYLTHDPGAESADRVGFTHTLNLANDHVPSAVDEMVWTARDAELLKQEAGIRAGGRVTEKPVKHVSLNWAPGETPTREHMIKTSESFLQHMGWQDHQTVLVAHTDKEHSHLHLCINVTHPETGLRLDDNFERRRTQAWALEYERENGMIHCGQRLKRPGEREDAPTRDAWMAFQDQKKEFERDEKSRRENRGNTDGDAINLRNTRAEEWKKLKELQRNEREAFFKDGKSVFSEIRSSVYREVREEYRGRWSDYYAAQKEGADPELLASQKAELLSEQKATLATRRDEACTGLRETRDRFYRGLLDGQRDARLDLTARQANDTDAADFLQTVEENAGGASAGFRTAASEATRRESIQAREEEHDAVNGSAGEAMTRPTAEVGMRAGVGLGAGLFKFFVGGLLEFTNEGSQVKARQSSTGPDLFEAAAEEASKRARELLETADREWREREKSRCWD